MFLFLSDFFLHSLSYLPSEAVRLGLSPASSAQPNWPFSQMVEVAEAVAGPFLALQVRPHVGG